MPPTLPDPTNFGNKPGDGPLRPGGEPLDPGATTPKAEQDRPSTMNHATKRQQPGLALVRDLWAGNEQVKARSTVYLPQAPAEEATNYNARLARSVFHNFYRRTVEGLVGLVFRKDPVLGDDVPPLIAEHWENVDMAGTHGDVFCRELCQDALIAGHAGILVDYPDTGGQRLTRADERGLRPYWVPIRKDDIVSFRTAVIAGRTMLIQLVLREKSYRPAGEFGEAEVTTYRRLFVDDKNVVRWQVLFETKEHAVVTMSEGVYTNQTEIPFAEVVTSGSVGILDSDPPLLDLAYLNVAHYQHWSDYAWAIHKTNVPFLFFAGVTLKQGETLKVSSNTAMSSQDPGAKAEYVAHDGASLESTRQALEDLKSDMGTMGLAMLSPQKRTAETAEAKRLDKATSDSALSVVARALQDAVERALGFHANYLRLPDGGSVEINRDFEGLLMEAPVMSAYAQLVQAGFPGRLVLKALQAGGRIAEDEDLEELEMEWLAGAEAEAQKRKEELEAQVSGPVGEKGPVAIEYDDNGRPARLVPDKRGAA